MRKALSVVLLAGMTSFNAPPREITIVGRDYSFAVPADVRPGQSVIRFENKGSHPHELNIVLLKPGVSVKEYMDSLRADKPGRMFRDAPVGVLFAGPGKSSDARLAVDFKAGRTYVMVCIFRDSSGAPRHHQLGMSAVVVPSGPTAAATWTRADTIAGADYAFTRYPRTLAPGVHRFAFVNDGKVRHEVSFTLLRPGVTLKQVLDSAKADKDFDGLLEGSFGVLASDGTTRPIGLVEIELKSGREYVIFCDFSDDAKSPPHFMLGMVGSIRVQPR